MRRLILPVLFLAAALAVDRGEWIARPSAELVMWGGRLGLLLAFLLAWRFRRGRAALAVGMIAALAEVWSEPLLEQVLATVWVLLPLQLALLPWLREWWVGSARGLLRFGILAVEIVLLYQLASAPEESPTRLWAGRLEQDLWSVAGLEAWPLPQVPTLAFLLAGILLALALVRQREPLPAGLLGVLGALGSGIFTPSSMPFFLAVAGGILAVSQVESAFALAFEDGLTSLPARRSLEESLRHLGRTYAVTMVDIDHFKRLNDRYGHEVGDQVLRMVAQELARVGGSGRAFRYGGEEFTLLFPRTTASEARQHSEALRKRIADRRFAVRGPARPKRKPKKKSSGRAGNPGIQVTVSMGVAERDTRRRTPEQVLEAADRALYRSKKGGRNRVTVA